MNSRVNFYVAAISGSALIGMLGVASLGRVDATGGVAVAVVLSLIGLAADLLDYDLLKGGAGSIAFIPYVAAALICPDWRVILIVSGCVAAIQVARGRASVKAVFNIAQTALSLAVGILVYRSLSGESYLVYSSGTVAHLLGITGLSSVALVVTFLVVNNIAVSGVLALAGNQGVRDVVRSVMVGTFRFTIFSAPLTILFAWVSVSSGVVWTIALALPLLGVRQLYKTTIQLQRGNQELLELMVKAIEARDPYTSGHSRRVSEAATIIARAAGLSEAEVDRVRIAALLHDVGKIHEDYAPILRKPGKLTNEEWELMKTHPARGAELVSTMSHLQDLVAPIRHHHERWDGRGYPDGLRGDAIPLSSRIITLADTLDALTSDRPYRAGLDEAEVRAEFIRCRGSQYDPDLCDRVLTAPVWSKLIGRIEQRMEPRRLQAL
jgi:putative nucleotidyltransferase with HDIG domain